MGQLNRHLILFLCLFWNRNDSLIGGRRKVPFLCYLMSWLLGMIEAETVYIWLVHTKLIIILLCNSLKSFWIYYTVKFQNQSVLAYVTCFISSDRHTLCFLFCVDKVPLSYLLFFVFSFFLFCFNPYNCIDFFLI